jgi:hypothetical protein
MRRLPSVLGGLVAMAVALCAPMANAATPTQRAHTADDVRAAFEHHGYQVSALSAWPDGVVTFAVDDGAAASIGQPLVHVIVFADADAASAFEGRQRGSGVSTSVGNVALVQVSRQSASMAPELDCPPDQIFYGDVPASPPPAGPPTSVDRRVLNLLGSL